MKEQKGERKVGTVIEALPNALFRVELPPESEGGSIGREDKDADEDAQQSNTTDAHSGNNANVILCYLAGKMRMYRIKVLVGDKVEVLLDPYGGKGRIVRRL